MLQQNEYTVQAFQRLQYLDQGEIPVRDYLSDLFQTITDLRVAIHCAQLNSVIHSEQSERAVLTHQLTRAARLSEHAQQILDTLERALVFTINAQSQEQN